MAVATSTLTARAVWWSAVRPATLAASVAPVLAGTAIAIHQGGIRPLAGLGALVVAICMQLGVNFANDYSDHLRGADSPARVGPMRAASSGVVPPAQVRFAAIGAFGVAALVGVVLSIATDWRLLIAGAACLAAGWLYTGGPRPYGYLGLGELFVFVFFGLVATCGTVYVESLRITPLAILFGCSLGFLASAILVLNHLRDMDSDAAAAQRQLGAGRARRHARAGASRRRALRGRRSGGGRARGGRGRPPEVIGEYRRCRIGLLELNRVAAAGDDANARAIDCLVEPRRR